ncbi:tetratricopeptide (TPR) repeat protein [Sinomonas atrocyanea]|uniref:XRE family transcriptional regulator n=1 Tax=Sinomonas atrocyanea TaxID=37927 RepID=UPI00278342AF|nr:XRE family transcriptional regulator [Sinomonas atrocyanea]MDP9884202.1 tetratricopeptide (TPR) repeat protein [Sinomonas atrocyanea]
MIADLAGRLGLAPEVLEGWDLGVEPGEAEWVQSGLAARQAWELRDYAGAASCAEAAAQAALAAGRQGIWWTMAYMRAECLMKQGQLAECRRIVQQLLEHRIVTESAGLAVRARQMLAAVCHGLGLLSTAVEHAREAVRLGARLPAGATVYIGALRALIAALAESGRLEEAWDHCRTLGPLVDEETTRQLCGEAEWVIGNVAFLRGDHQEGLGHHERARELLSPTADIELWAPFNKATAAVRLTAGILGPETLAAVERAELALSIVGGPRREHLEVALIRARWLHLTGQAAEAADRLKTIHAERSLLGRHTAGEVALLYGRALKALGRNDEAVELLDTALADFSATGLPHRIGAAAETTPTVAGD